MLPQGWSDLLINWVLMRDWAAVQCPDTARPVSSELSTAIELVQICNFIWLIADSIQNMQNKMATQNMQIEMHNMQKKMQNMWFNIQNLQNNMQYNMIVWQYVEMAIC